MTAYTTLANTLFLQDKPITSSTGLALRDNPISIAEGDPSAPSVLAGAIAGGASGAVGTYAFAWANIVGPIAFGDTVAGSLLRPAGLSSDADPSTATGVLYASSTYFDGSGTDAPTFSGTWRCMGGTTTNTLFDSYPLTLWLRIV